jgi:nucleoid DNA-binding protein
MNSTKSNIYEEILDELKSEFNLSKMELERIVDSQFRVLRDTMSNREGKVIQMIYLGKFRPTAYNQDYTNRLKLKEDECVD